LFWIWIGHVANQILILPQLLAYGVVGLKYGMGVSTVAGEIQKGWIELGYPVKSRNQRLLNYVVSHKDR